MENMDFIVGVALSIGCMGIYFSIPNLYYSRFFKSILYFGAVAGCYLILAQQGAFIPGVFWTSFVLLFSYYASGSSWYLRGVLNLTYKEWEKQIASEEKSEVKPEHGVYWRVAESWNPKWKPEQLTKLTHNVNSIDDLIKNIQTGKWK